MIRVGIGGWTFPLWRGAFYPAGLAQAKELDFASRHVTAITRFLDSGVVELGPKLGPILWQFAPTKRFDEADFDAFLGLLPGRIDGVRLRHVVEVRHDSFRIPAFVALLRRHGVAAVLADSAKHPLIPDLTADFVYARLQRAEDDIATGYPPTELDRWAARARAWAAGSAPADLPPVSDAADPNSNVLVAGQPRAVFIFMINGAKIRAPAAAMALLERLGATPTG